MILTEDQIERRVEIFTDALDRQFMAGTISQTEYDREIAILDKWATGQRFARNWRDSQ